jgi:hypothetical protein
MRQRHARMPVPLLVGLLVAAIAAVIAPFLIVLSGLEWGAQRDLQWLLGAIVVFFLVFPMLARVFGRRDSTREVV